MSGGSRRVETVTEVRREWNAFLSARATPKVFALRGRLSARDVSGGSHRVETVTEVRQEWNFSSTGPGLAAGRALVAAVFVRGAGHWRNVRARW